MGYSFSSLTGVIILLQAGNVIITNVQYYTHKTRVHNIILRGASLILLQYENVTYDIESHCIFEGGFLTILTTRYIAANILSLLYSNRQK